MYNLGKYIKNTLDGILVFGDIHGDYKSFNRAYSFAKSENLFFMSLGDLVDRDRQPFEVIQSMYEIMQEGLGGFTIGNHDDKHYRAFNGANVSFSKDAKQTLIDVGEDRMNTFKEMYTGIIDDTLLSSLYHKFDDITLVHAASHPCMWENSPTIGKSERSRFIVGETNGEKYDDGYPVRLYNWIDEIPMGKIVIVGHDKQPINNIPITEPMHITNKNGGKVIFLDTGCGKGGFLSGIVIMPNKQGKFGIISTEAFNE